MIDRPAGRSSAVTPGSCSSALSGACRRRLARTGRCCVARCGQRWQARTASPSSVSGSAWMGGSTATHPVLGQQGAEPVGATPRSGTAPAYRQRRQPATSFRSAPGGGRTARTARADSCPLAVGHGARCAFGDGTGRFAASPAPMAARPAGRGVRGSPGRGLTGKSPPTSHVPYQWACVRERRTSPTLISANPRIIFRESAT